LPGALQTNQRAELAAILRALEISPKNREVHIVTDSEYSINCVTKWYKSWERNDWQTSVKKPVLNKDLIQGVLAKIKDREALGTATRFSWVKGHSKDPGNEAADRLAVLGAQLPHLD
jgi:ribonuclease HI